MPDSSRIIGLNEVVISANRVQERKADIPQQIDVLTARAIRLQNLATTADALQQSGWVFVQKSQLGGGSPVLRGFEANKVLLVVDGVRLNNAIYRAGHLQNILSVDANSLERVEILNGAGAVPYGSDALGGVISLYTKTPALADSTGFTAHTSNLLRYASAAHEKTAHTDFSLGWRRWASFTSLNATDFDDLRKGRRGLKDYPGFGEVRQYAARQDGKDVVLTNDEPHRQKFSGYRQLDLVQKVLFQPQAGQRHLLNLQLSTTSEVPRFDRLQTYRNGALRYAEWRYGPQQRLLGSYQLELTRTSGLYDRLRLTPAVQAVQESRLVRDFGKDVRQENTENVRVLSTNLDLFKNIGRHELRYGAELTHNKVRSRGEGVSVTTGLRTPIATRYPNGATYATAGLYAAHRWEITDRLILSDGLRYSHVRTEAAFDQRFFDTQYRSVKQRASSVDGNVGLVAMLPAGLRLSGVVATGFRNPNVDDLNKTFEQTNGTLIIPNPGLRPERVVNYEAEVSETVPDRLLVAVTGFYTNLRDALVVRPFATPDGKTTTIFNGQPYATVATVNTGRARVRGLSVRTQLALPAHLRLDGTLTYTHGRDLTADVPLDHIAPLFGRAALTYQHRRLTAEGSMLFNGRKRTEDYSPTGEDNLPQATPAGALGWYTLNVRSNYQLTPRWAVQAGLENILDTNYRVFASGISAPGRNVVVAVRFER
ncbi:hemoglobin/transferrin/lactoferrin receptor protein [Hymenobacter daecheongensis DSM 21074]|uniref:Hemoglobin/transferrin/lactoferrin receptor protein n=2 Tax=Hymenobacter daecheongensis TaxID=496053 RepID=A0A1M6D544_9BACT|nr:hemoglobin/transferrin/lactoferrin receptor protein [Hymenobacter daecheongensis DSM 21074]